MGADGLKHLKLLSLHQLLIIQEAPIGNDRMIHDVLDLIDDLGADCFHWKFTSYSRIGQADI